MNRLKVVAVKFEGILFENDVFLYDYHDTSCCESHQLYFQDLILADFEGLEFDLSNDKFFKRIDGYGIELIPIKGFPIRIAGHGSNNGWYSSDLTLILKDSNGDCKKFDITECQDIN